MPSLRVVQSVRAPAAIGPYSQGIIHGGILYTAGQIALDPASGEFLGGGVAKETEQILRNLEGVLTAAGASFATVLKTTVFLRDMDDFGRMNEAYARFFSEHKPARSTVQVARLPRDAAVEIELVAAVSAVDG